MTRILLLSAALVALFLSGCASGGANQPVYTAVDTRTGFGQIRVVYGDPEDSTKHPTEWNLDSGSWRSVGAPAIEVGAYTHQVKFRALNSQDEAPPAMAVVVKQDKRAVVKVQYP